MAAAPDENTMRQRRLLRQALPHLITMIVTLGVGWLWWGQTRTVVVQMPAATAMVAPAAVTVVAAMTATSRHRRNKADAHGLRVSNNV